MAYGGVLSNTFRSMVSIAVLCRIKIENIYLLFSIRLFLTLHLVEMVSYLFVGKLFGKRYGEYRAMLPKTEISEFHFGLYTNSRLSFVLSIVPPEIFWTVLVWNAATFLCMCGGRIIFSAIHAKRHTDE